MVTKIISVRFQHSPIKTVGDRESVKNRRKNANDLHDLDFALVTLRSPGYVTLTIPTYDAILVKIGGH